MEVEEEMIEEHLDEEYQNSEMESGFVEVGNQIDELERIKLAANHDREVQEKLEKVIALMRLHVQNYQRIIIFNRRRARHRLRKRQCTLRNFFLQSLMEMQIRFVETLPLAIDPLLLLENNLSKHQRKEQDSYNFAKKYDKKSKNFYKEIASQYTNDQWVDTFHMSICTFHLLCNRLKTSLDNIDMDLENWTVMCIYMFATGSRFSSVAMLFNVEKKFVRKSLFKFSECLLDEFSEKMSMPNSKSELENIANGFHKATIMLPCVAGVLSLFQVPNVCDCGDNKTCGSESLKVQVCIDNSLLFRKVETATSHKPTMFVRSPNEISLHSKKISENCEVPYFIVAPNIYPLRKWLMQKYDEPREHWEYNFNKCCGNLNLYREVALRRLFGRWHILGLTECILPESKSFIVKACCLLHNIMEENKEYFSMEWCKDFNPTIYECRISAALTQLFNDSKPALEKRELIAKLAISSNMQNK